jgi:hypothetical protein
VVIVYSNYVAYNVPTYYCAERYSLKLLLDTDIIFYMYVLNSDSRYTVRVCYYVMCDGSRSLYLFYWAGH